MSSKQSTLVPAGNRGDDAPDPVTPVHALTYVPKSTTVAIIQAGK
jgi:hypothetical protein